MATKNNSEQIFVGINDQRVELTGVELEEFLSLREADNAARALLEAKESERKQLRIDAITKLGAASGLTEEEINSILNI